MSGARLRSALTTILAWSVGVGLPGCRQAESAASSPSPASSQGPAGSQSAATGQHTSGDGGDGRHSGEQAFKRLRERMVDHQIASRDVHDEAVLRAMREVPRHRFVPERLRGEAYSDRPLPIGHEQTISQPYIVAKMTELAAVGPGDTVLDVGTGSGYQAAVLARLVRHVYSIEIVEPLAKRAEGLLAELGADNVTVRHGDGYDGWLEQAPFDAIVVAAAPAEVPRPLLKQLKVGGRLVIPVGEGRQTLVVYERTPEGIVERTEMGVRFVPMTGKALR